MRVTDCLGREMFVGDIFMQGGSSMCGPYIFVGVGESARSLQYIGINKWIKEAIQKGRKSSLKSYMNGSLDRLGKRVVKVRQEDLSSVDDEIYQYLLINLPMAKYRAQFEKILKRENGYSTHGAVPYEEPARNVGSNVNNIVARWTIDSPETSNPELSGLTLMPSLGSSTHVVNLGQSFGTTGRPTTYPGVTDSTITLQTGRGGYELLSSELSQEQVSLLMADYNVHTVTQSPNEAEQADNTLQELLGP